MMLSGTSLFFSVDDFSNFRVNMLPSNQPLFDWCDYISCFNQHGFAGINNHKSIANSFRVDLLHRRLKGTNGVYMRTGFEILK